MIHFEMHYVSLFTNLQIVLCLWSTLAKREDVSECSISNIY